MMVTFRRVENLPILVDLQEFRAFDAIGSVAKLPQLDIVRQVKLFKKDGDFVRIWPCAMGVEDKWLDHGCLCCWDEVCMLSRTCVTGTMRDRRKATE